MAHSGAAHRRRFLACFAGLGLSSTLFPGVLWAQLQRSRTSRITKVMLHDAADVAGMTFTERELDAMLDAVNLNVGRLDEIHKAPMENAVALPLYFNPAVPGIRIERTKRPIRTSAPPRVTRPEKPAKRDGGHRSSRRAFGDRSEQRLARPAMNEGARGEVSLRMVPRPSAP